MTEQENGDNSRLSPMTTTMTTIKLALSLEQVLLQEHRKGAGGARAPPIIFERGAEHLQYYNYL